ncbi:hypothetical protein RSO01_91120 [Reyranella soli]|uniref:RNA polymerase alpha subunit C-terminal domain-containing protein n=1 Tax=Reyranella soli TaxID=1230389 RepID=A0A512NSL5_9HYPH|nr:hypothetical protein RSO01_91120 [Reyranella soli]
MTHDGSRNVSSSSGNPYRKEGLRGPLISGFGAMSHIRRKLSSFEEYWRASKAWERQGLPLGTGRALANAGFLKVDDLRSANALELASIPRVGRKSLAILHKLANRTQARP